jgi:hypothetical protein
VPGQRQRRQPQPGRPPLGPLMQHRQHWFGQLCPSRAHQVPRLIDGEPQVGLADLGQLAFQPQPVQAQPQVMPGRQHEPQRFRRAHDQQLQLAPRLARAQFVHVIDDQPDRVLQWHQVLQQPLGDDPPVQIGRPRQLPHQHRPRCRLAQCAEHRQPEPLRIALVASRRHPRHALGQACLSNPRPQQDCLAAPRRRRDHGHALRGAQPLGQPRAGNNADRTRARVPAGQDIRSLSRPHR